MWARHNFFGPGESDYSQRPIDSDDRIAMRHDLLYERARSFKDIHVADSIAIREFASDVGNWHSLIGAVGLGVKYGVEGSIGTNIYPRLQVASGRTGNLLTKAITAGGIRPTTRRKGRRLTAGGERLNTRARRLPRVRRHRTTFRPFYEPRKW